MSKGSSNFKSKRSHTSKPYDASQSFVAKVASRVSEILPQTTWLNRWLSPAEANIHRHGGSSQHVTSTPSLDLHGSPVSVDGPGPSKRPRLPLNSPFLHNNYLQSTAIHEEELSPIAAPPNDIAVAGPSGLNQLSQRNNFTPRSSTSTAGDPPQSKLEDKLTSAAQRSSTPAATATATSADKLNGDDCSETSESTSGCSSLVPQAQHLQSRRSESRHLSFSGNRSVTSGFDRSIFPGRSSPKVDLTSLHRRRPSFDTTAFTSSSKLLHITANPNQTSSPFYSGRTMYGGASAYNTSSSGLFSTPRRSGVTVRPVNVNSPAETALSTTAKKILDALEQFSTPVVDAKRLPIVPGTKRKLERYAELNLPTTSELLRVKRRERLQKSTSAARQASLSSSHQSSKSNLGQPETDYRIGNNTGDGRHTGKLTRNYCLEGGGKEEVNLPAAVLPVQTLPKIDIPVPPPKPLTTAISSTPISAATFTARNSMSVETTSVSTSSTKPTVVTPSREFNISEPVPVKADVSSRTSLSAEQFNFVFSEPIVQSNKNVNSGLSCLNFNKGKDNSNMFSCKNTVSESNSGSSGKVIGLGFNMKSNVVSTNVSTLGVKKVVESSPSTPVSATINSDSISRSPDNNFYWKCSMCMVRNNPETNICIACDAKKTNVTFSSSSVTSSSPLKFKPPPDTWECKECYVRNKNSVAVCAACASPKGSNLPIVSSSSNTSTIVSTVPSFSTVTSIVSTSTTSVTSTKFLSGFGDKFKPPSDTWECKECFVRNKNTTDECVSCGSKSSKNVKKDVIPTCTLVSSNTPVSSGFGNLFKKPEGSWECGSCMVRNDAKSVKCVACETPKPGAEKSTTTNNKLAVTSSATSSITSCGFQFGIPQGTANESKGLLSSNNNKEGFKIAEFQFGSTKPSNTTASATTAAPTFTFGIPQSKPLTNDESLPKEKKNKTLVNDKLPSNPLQELAKLQEKQTGIIQSSGFIFSASNDTTVEKKEVNVDNNISKNLFGVVDKTKTNDLSNKIEDVSKTSTSTPVSNAFVFGATSTLDKTDSMNKTSNFIFQPKTDQTTSAATKLIFGNATTTQSQETKKSTTSELFTFGSSAKSTNNSSTVFSSSTAKPNAPFLFGTAASTNENKSGMVFGATSTDNEKPAVSVPEIKPVFCNTSKETTSIFGNVKPDVKLPVFGGSLVNDTKPAVSNALTNSTGVKFGAVVNSNANTGSLQSGFKQETPATTPSFLFGSSAASPFQSQSNSQQPEKAMFAMTNSNNNTNIQSVPPTTQASTAFSFGTGTAGIVNNEQPKSTFGFSSQTPQPSGFSFNPASSTTPAQNFNFTPKEAESSSTGFNFSTVPAVQSNPATPAFGVQQNAVPSFGSSNLFSFGSQSAQPQSVEPASSTPVFGFNSSQANAAVSNAFVFGSSNADATAASAASTTPAVPAFDPNARPTFNFTGGSTPSFTATPAPGTPVSSQVSRRPIKKAVRRSGQIR